MLSHACRTITVFTTAFVILASALGFSIFFYIDSQKECGIIHKCPTETCETKCPTKCFDNHCLLETSDTSFANTNIQYNNYTNGTFWENSTVPFIIDSNLTNSQKLTITKGIQSFNQLTPIKLIPKTNESDYLIFTSDPEDICGSFLGRLAGWQKIFIGIRCDESAVHHEIMHALGWPHEQSRPDRDTYIDVLTENIIDDDAHNFNIKTSFIWNSIENFTDYDYDSIMHYNSYSFSNNSQPTILTKLGDEIPDNKNISETDLIELQMYSDISNNI